MKMLGKRTLISVNARMVAESTRDCRLLIDIREPSCYEKTHIRDSINLLTSSLLLRRLQRGSLDIRNLLPQNIVEKLEKDGKCDTIVVYDENSSSEAESRTLSVIGNCLKKSFPKKNVFFLNGGFAELCAKYPRCCDFDYPVDHPNRFQISLNTQELNDPTDRGGAFSPDDDVCPVEILPYLYLGNAHHSSQKDLLDKLGVTAILNVSRTCPMLFQNNYIYKTIPVDDNHTENISSHFDEAIQFIDDIKSKNGILLVHCRAGISRSATICIAYLMRQYGYTLDQAYEYTKKRRTNISPNFNFLGQLLALENEVKNTQQKLDGKQSPACLTLNVPKLNSVPLPLETPLTVGLKTGQLFTYSPKSCMNFFTLPGENITPYALLTPS